MVGWFWSYNSLNLPSTRIPYQDQEATRKAYIRTHFGQHILWNEYSSGGGGGRHLSANVLEPYRQKGDPIFDRILELYSQENRPLKANDDFFARVAQQQPNGDDDDDDDASPTTGTKSQADKALEEALQKYSRVPLWVDKEQLKRGQEVFLAYLPAIGMSLYYRSLVPGFSIPKIAAVLQATAYLAPPSSKEAVHERLMDTGAFLGACLQSDNVNELLPQGNGWKAALRVRVLHAKVRRQLLLRNNTRQWDTKKYGIPINQEDMVATLLAFSTNSLLGAEMLLGRPLPMQDRLDYLALWRYLGWLLGVDVNDDEDENNDFNDDDADGLDTKQSRKLKALDPCGPGWHVANPDPMAHSYSIFQSIIVHLLHPDTSSVSIAHHLLRQGRRQDGDTQTKRDDMNWFYFRCLQCRRFVGDPLADALELPLRPTWWGRLKQWAISTVYLTIATLYTIAGLPMSPLRQRIVRFHRGHMARFVDVWTEGLSGRMRNKSKSSTKSEEQPSNGPVCPFAMVLPEQEQNQ